MRIHNFLGKLGLVVVGAKHGIHPPSRDYEKKEGGRRGQPVPKERLGHSSRGRDGAKIGANLFPERGRRGLIELRELQSPSQQVQVHEFNGAVDTMLEVALEFTSARSTQLTVKIALKEGVSKVTPHGQPPYDRNLSARNIT